MDWWFWITFALWIWVVIRPRILLHGVISGVFFSIVPTVVFWAVSMFLMLFVGVFFEIQDQQAVEDQQELISPAPKGTFYDDPKDVLRPYE